MFSLTLMMKTTTTRTRKKEKILLNKLDRIAPLITDPPPLKLHQ